MICPCTLLTLGVSVVLIENLMVTIMDGAMDGRLTK